MSTRWSERAQLGVSGLTLGLLGGAEDLRAAGRMGVVVGLVSGLKDDNSGSMACAPGLIDSGRAGARSMNSALRIRRRLSPPSALNVLGPARLL